MFLVDGYKISHYDMYQDGTEVVYSNFTPRSNKYAPKGNNGKVLNFGHQYAIRFIVEHFNENFFAIEKSVVLKDVKDNFSAYLGVDYDTKHIEELYDLGYLPLEIRTLDEGTESAVKIPVLFLYNTDNRFAWVTNYIETVLSNLLWQPLTTATNVLLMKRIVREAVLRTDKDNVGAVDFMLHDFSMRGLTGLDAAIGSGLAFASVSMGSDSLPVIKASQHYYDETTTPVFSVRASEHSQMTAGGIEGEFEIYKDLLTKFPTGIMSLVSDSFDLWRVLTDYLPKLKDIIMARDGKLVIRPDSGNPTDIICGLNFSRDIVEAGKKGIAYLNNGKYHVVELIGDDEYNHGQWGTTGVYKEQPSNKGVIELLWDVFGGTVNKQGFKVLDSHIGMIYGEAINQNNIKEIFQRLEDKGFAASNCFFGQGSFSMQMVTRDTWGMALKCIAQQRNGKLVEIMKDPITDDGIKKSAKGLTVVFKDENGEYYLKDQASIEEVLSEENQLKVRFKDGEYFNQSTLTQIRQRINGGN
ncbi:MAG TPA: nicotinate phosphoribosyltransferase [Nitrososphaeraceae archaeon]|nr:nicotinate phosphoribosyltransferase [Nitrososphaeraceae archaeon]